MTGDTPMTTPDLRERVIREITVAPGWNKEDATVLVDDLIAVVAAKDRATIERLTRALRVNTHSPHDQAGDPIEGFPVCSVCGAIQTGAAPAQPEPLDVERLAEAIFMAGTDDSAAVRIGNDSFGAVQSRRFAREVAVEYERLTPSRKVAP